MAARRGFVMMKQSDRPDRAAGAQVGARMRIYLLHPTLEMPDTTFLLCWADDNITLKQSLSCRLSQIRMGSAKGNFSLDEINVKLVIAVD